MKRITRRCFLEESLLAATAASVSAKLPAFAGERQSKSANERLAIAVLGAGSRGPAHARAFATRSDCEVVAVCDPDRNRAEKLAASVEKIQGRKPRALQDLRHLCDDPKIHCFSVASCNHWHALSAVWAMQAGKDVYLEKPVSHNLSEGRRIVQTAREYHRICQVGTQYRSDGTCLAAGRYLAEGRLGKVNVARSITYKRRRSIGPEVKGKVPDSVDYDIWAGPAPLAPITRQNFHYDWHWFWDTGNGDLGNSDVHRADLVSFGLKLDRLSRAVLCFGGRVGYEDAAETPNTQIVLHDLGDATFVQEVRGLATPPFRMHGGAIFVGEEGYIGMAGGKSALFDLDGEKVRDFQGPGEDHFANFVKAVRSRRREDLNAEILGGHISAGLCHLGNISYRLGRPASPQAIANRLGARKLHDDTADTLQRTREHLARNGVDIDKTRLVLGPWLEFDAEKEVFPGKTAPNGLLTREYRKPFVMPL